MAPRFIRLTPRGFDSILESAAYVLLRLDRSPRVEFHDGVAEFFHAAYPRLFAFGSMSRVDFTDPDFLASALQSAVGPLRAGVPDGYYLLHAGVVVGHHRGVLRPSNVSYDRGPEAEVLRDRLMRLAFPGRSVSPRDVNAAMLIVAYFDAIVARKQGASDGQRDRYVYEDRQATSPVAPPAAMSGDPFAVLGVDSAASDQDIKAAYREQMKMNHPDKVAHLSPALQKFAQAQVLEIKAAYERIMSMRRPG